MKNSTNNKMWIVLRVLGVLLVAHSLPMLANTHNRRAENQPQKPSISITVTPHAGKGGEDEMEKIAGTVSGVKAEDYVVVIFVYTDKWYVQPYIDSPYTSIDNKNNWESDTHLGKEYAALLVKPSFKPPDKPKVLPKVGDDVAAIVRVAGK